MRVLGLLVLMGGVACSDAVQPSEHAPHDCDTVCLSVPAPAQLTLRLGVNNTTVIVDTLYFNPTWLVFDSTTRQVDVSYEPDSLGFIGIIAGSGGTYYPDRTVFLLRAQASGTRFGRARIRIASRLNPAVARYVEVELLP